MMTEGGERYDWLEYVPSCFNWEDVIDVFVKHDVEQVHWQEKTSIHIIWFGMIKTKKGDIVGSKIKSLKISL